MPPEERPTKVAERCEVHPNRVAAVHCSSCERPICLRCAVPVRGRVLGPECLRDALGDEAPVEPIPKRARRPIPQVVAGGAFGLAVITSLLPWTRFASGSGFAGAWALDLRWSMLAALAAVVGLSGWLLGRRIGLLGIWSLVMIGLFGSIGAGMAIIHPPPFKQASIAPLIAGLLLLTGATAAALGIGRPSDLRR